MIDMLVNSMEEKFKEAEKGLVNLLSEVDPERLLVAVSALMVSSPVRESIGDYNGTNSAQIEILTYYALRMAGASTQTRPVCPIETNSCQQFLEDILMSKTWASMGKSGKQLFRSPADFIKMQSEVVRGYAYPEQTAGKIAQIQGRFDNWFNHKIGISPSRAVDIIFSIVKHIEETFNEILDELRKESDSYVECWNAETKEVSVEINGHTCSAIVVDKDTAKSFVFLSNFNQKIPDRLPVCISGIPLTPAITIEEEQAIKRLIGLSANNFDKKIIALNDVRKYPLYELTDGRVILSDLSNTMDFLWEAFESVAKSDQFFYNKRYQKHKSKWVENKAIDYLKRIFPDSAVYQTLDYPDLSKNDGSTTELDIAVKWVPFLVIVEIKAKQFRLESQMGDAAKLRSDLKANIEDAHKQALRAIEYVNSAAEVTFNERYAGRTLTVIKDDIYKVFPVSISLHQLAFISAQLDKTKEFGLFSDDDYPFSVAISDFDLLTRTCNTPDVLLHYMEKRISMINDSEDYHGDEIDLFAAYLDSRLHRSSFIKPGEKFTMMAFTGYPSKFDQLMMHDRGEDVECPDIRLAVPSEIDNLLRELRQRDDKGARLISFALLDLDNALLNAIDLTISKLKNQTISNGIFRRGTFASDDVAISIVASNKYPYSIDELNKKIRQRVLIEKYRRKLNKSIGIGIVCQREEQVLEIASYAEFDWAPDPEMETLIEEEAPFVPEPGVKLPGANKPCICGSGKKYKKCCKRKIEDSRSKFSP